MLECIKNEHDPKVFPPTVPSYSWSISYCYEDNLTLYILSEDCNEIMFELYLEPNLCTNVVYKLSTEKDYEVNFLYTPNGNSTEFLGEQ